MTIHIWTDGSCNPNPGPGGAAWVILREGRKPVKGSQGYRLTTNNRMEMMAAAMALSDILIGAEIVVHSDSQYLVNAFVKGWMMKWMREDWRRSDGARVKNVDLWMDLYAVTAYQHVEWVWERGHDGGEWNMLADAMAAEAALRPTLHDVNYERSIR
jgi:ribonuclease HI